MTVTYANGGGDEFFYMNFDSDATAEAYIALNKAAGNGTAYTDAGWAKSKFYVAEAGKAVTQAMIKKIAVDSDAITAFEMGSDWSGNKADGKGHGFVDEDGKYDNMD